MDGAPQEPALGNDDYQNPRTEALSARLGSPCTGTHHDLGPLCRVQGTAARGLEAVRSPRDEHDAARRPEVATKEMLRVLKSGGRLAFSTWPPELYVGRMFALVVGYLPPAGDPKPAAPWLWGDPNVAAQRLGNAVRDLTFDRGTLMTPALSPQHYRALHEQTAAMVIR